MSLNDALQGAIHTGQSITWTRDDGTPQDLSGATLSGTIQSVRTGASVAIAGTLAIVTAASGIFTWAYAAADVAAAGEYLVQFSASYSGALDTSRAYAWRVLPIAASAAPRATMTHLIARLKKLCNNDTTLTDFDYQELLDDHAIVVTGLLRPQIPFYTLHAAPFENLEAGAHVFYGFNTLLTENTDYTADYQRGLFTTPQADYRGLRIQGTAFDLNGAAADGWERIASAQSDAFAWSDVEGSYHPEQARQFALDMAAKYRRKAWAIGHVVERADTPPLRDADGRADLLRRERAGYGSA